MCACILLTRGKNEYRWHAVPLYSFLLHNSCGSGRPTHICKQFWRIFIVRINKHIQLSFTDRVAYSACFITNSESKYEKNERNRSIDLRTNVTRMCNTNLANNPKWFRTFWFLQLVHYFKLVPSHNLCCHENLEFDNKVPRLQVPAC